MASISDTNHEHIGFSPTVKAIQQRKGSRRQYARMIERSPLEAEITDELATFVGTLRSFYLATASADGQPYVQHRGGPPGFLHVVNRRTFAFADFKGNRQFISQGNLEDNKKAFMFFMDYRTRTRIKVWGEAEVREDQPDVLADLMDKLDGYRAKPEQLIYFRVKAWELNCKQHIPVRYEQEEVERMLEQRDQRIEELEHRLEELLALQQ